MHIRIALLLLIYSLSSLGKVYSLSNDTSAFKPNRFYPLIIGSNVAYAGSMIGLNEIWYKNSPKSSFHFFNDNKEWLQVDKIGHFATSFHESKFAIKALQWSGISQGKAVFWGSMAGFIYQAPIEILDGYSSSYGASWGDLLADEAGHLAIISQYLLWNEFRIQPKFSFHHTPYASLRPNQLGNNFSEQWLKDYNGQTYWLSFNVSSFIKKSDNRIPKWINLSLGYGGEKIIYALKNDNIKHGYMSYRQYYLSFDIDFDRVKIKSKVLKTILYPLNFIHIPFPALEINSKGLKLYPFYF